MHCSFFQSFRPVDLKSPTDLSDIPTDLTDLWTYRPVIVGFARPARWQSNETQLSWPGQWPSTCKKPKTTRDNGQVRAKTNWSGSCRHCKTLIRKMKDSCGDPDNGKARAKTERSGVRLGKWTTKGPMASKTLGFSKMRTLFYRSTRPSSVHAKRFSFINVSTCFQEWLKQRFT